MYIDTSIMTRLPEEMDRQTAVIDDPVERIKALNAVVLQIYHDDPRQAMELSRELFQLAESIGDRRTQARMLRSMATCCERMSNYPDALTHARAAIEMYRTMDDRSGIASGLVSLG